MVKKLGKAFVEELETYTFKKTRRQNRETGDEIQTAISPSRVVALTITLLLVFVVLGARLFDLMIVHGKDNRDASENNRIRLNVINAPRGIIYDRNNIALVRNNAKYQIKESEGKTKIITREEALKMEADNSSESAKIVIGPVREYIFGEKLAHLLGYMTEATEDEVGNKLLGYKLGDKVGRFGVEEVAESKLRGINGKELVEVDAMARTIKKLGEKAPIPGSDLHLTIDLKLQQLIADNFPKDQKGAVIASSPQNGEVLAMYSSPSFDPNLFTGNVPASSIQLLASVLSDPNAPLFNRAVAGTYPSGSTYKIVTSAAGLENGKINASTEIEDTGELVIGPYRFPNWYWIEYGGKEGFINVVRAIKRSNDIFFYKVGEMVGLDNMVEMAKRFGLSQKTGIDLPHESAGLMPTEEWKQKVIGDNWYLGDTYHLAIGQGYLLVTPIQVNAMTNVIANGGKLCKPHLISDTLDTSKVAEGLLRGECRDIGLKKETIDLIKEGMHEACMAGGTAWPFFDFTTPVGCKTGTAEFGDPKDRTHAWFTIFAPLDNPTISMTVLVEGAGEGSNEAAPVAKKVLGEWLK